MLPRQHFEIAYDLPANRTLKKGHGYVVFGITSVFSPRDLESVKRQEPGDKFWPSVMNELKNHGSQGVFITAVDDLKAFFSKIG